jgi:hypothetical protein
MQMAMNLRCAVLIFSVLLLSVSAEAFDNYKAFHRDTWDFEVDANYFSSKKNFDSSGKSYALLDGNSYNLMSGALQTRYTPRRSLSVFGSLDFAQSQSKDTLSTRTNSSLTGALIGIDYMMYSGPYFDFVPQTSVKIPFEAIDPDSDSSINSEGVVEVEARGTIQRDFNPLFTYGSLGVTYRAEGRSFLLPWGMGLQMKLSPRWRIGAELFGSVSTTDDADTGDDFKRISHIATVNAGSMAFYSVNPDVVDSNFFARVRITKALMLEGNGGMTLAGKNTADGWHVGGFLRYTFDMTEGYVHEPEPVPIASPVPQYKSNMYKQPDLTPETQVKKFKEDTSDGVDQKIFKAKPAKKPKPAPSMAPAEDFSVQLKGNTGKKKKRKKPVPRY